MTLMDKSFMYIPIYNNNKRRHGDSSVNKKQRRDANANKKQRDANVNKRKQL